MGSKRMLGTRINRLDAKGRMAIPAKWREQLGEEVVVTAGMESCLFVYRTDDFDELADKIEDAPFLSDESARYFQRKMLSDAEELSLDKQGRILLTPEHRKYAQLESEMDVVVKGVGNHLEIWNAAIWEKYENEGSYSESGKALREQGL